LNPDAISEPVSVSKLLVRHHRLAERIANQSQPALTAERYIHFCHKVGKGGPQHAAPVGFRCRIDHLKAVAVIPARREGEQQ
jgi:hypothetical protein